VAKWNRPTVDFRTRELPWITCIERTVVVRLSKGLVAAAGVAGLLVPVLAASPALASPEINQADCKAANGTFSREKGVKSCTTTTTQLENNVRQEIQAGFLTATWLENRTWTVTTTQSQKGNGEVNSNSEDPVLVDRLVHSQTCEAELFGNSMQVGIENCYGLYPS